jgi:N-acetylglutamate synthase-like GNAT family acetyltransferase
MLNHNHIGTEPILPGRVDEGGGRAAARGALHVMWEDLAEIRTVAVREDCQGLGIGHAIVDTLLRRARAVGVSRVFCLTFAVEFFRRHGFQWISGTPAAAEVYRELLRSYDEGVAEFLDLEREKPNTLGNTAPSGMAAGCLAGGLEIYGTAGSIRPQKRANWVISMVTRSRSWFSA